MSVQTSYPAAPGPGYAGQLADTGPHYIVSGIASAEIVAGIVVMRSDAGQGVAPPTAAVASATAIIATGGASTAGIQTLTGAAFNGAIGGRAMRPPRNLVVAFDSSTDWDPTTAVVTGIDADGEIITEDFAVATSASRTGTKLFASVTSVSIPAQTGTGGTFTMGIGSLLGDMTGSIAGAALYDAAREPGAFAPYASVGVLRQGRVRMTAEAGSGAGQPVWVRIIATGSEVVGAVRGTADADDCVRLRGALFVSDVSGGLATVDFNLPS